MSRSHARVTVDADGTCAIEDLGSTNGTFVNGLRVSAPQTLSEGDTIEIGATTLVVRELSSPSTAELHEPEPGEAAGRPQKTVTQTPAIPAPFPAGTDAAPAAAQPPPMAEPAAPGPAMPGDGAPGGGMTEPAPFAPPEPAPAAEPEPAPFAPPEPAPAAEEGPDLPADEPAPAAAAIAFPSPAPADADAEGLSLPPILSLQLEIDFRARETRIWVDNDREPLRVVFDGATWRAAPSPANEKGTPA
jgi:pSer/pThr/pTyr-binding forkhead associated (FHA) protein